MYGKRWHQKPGGVLHVLVAHLSLSVSLVESFSQFEEHLPSPFRHKRMPILAPSKTREEVYTPPTLGRGFVRSNRGRMLALYHSPV